MLFFVLIPVFIWGVIEALLPITFFTHRHWESIFFQTKVPAKTEIYPNVSSSMDAVGDLCFNTKYKVVKHEVWITDKLGFRNDSFTEQPDILFIGDSFTAGTGLSQDEIISNKVKKKLSGVTVYNMAPSNFDEFDRHFKLGLIKKPKLIIFSSTERHPPKLFTPYIPNKNNVINRTIVNAFSFCSINVFIDKMLKFNSIKRIRSIIYGYNGWGVQSKINPKMFFLHGMNQTYNTQNLYKTRDALLSYKKYCDALGIKFLFLPIPNKETVYFDLVPFEKQPNYMFMLDSIVRNSNINTINSLNVYNDYRKSNPNLLYHFDDTHWNANGVEVLSKQIADEVKRMYKVDLAKTAAF